MISSTLGQGKYKLNELHLANLDKYVQYGPIVREEFQPGHPVVHLFEPNDYASVLRNQGPAPLRPPNEFVCHYRSRHPERYPNAGIANLQGEQWAEQRRLLAPALLKLGALDAYLPQINQLAQELVQCILRKGNDHRDHEINAGHRSSIDILDLQSLAYRLALEAICALCLDTRLHCLDTDQITTDGRTLVEATCQLFDAYQQLYYAPPLWKLYDTPAFIQLASAESTIYETAGRYIESAMGELNDEIHLDKQSERPSLMRTLISIPKLDRRDIRTLILDFIAGGINTTSNMLAVALWHLASNPSKQQILYNELSQLFPQHRQSNSDVNVDSNKLNKSKYLRACLKESFRLDSPIPCIVRTLTNDQELAGYHVPAGVSCDPKNFHFLNNEKDEFHLTDYRLWAHFQRLSSGEKLCGSDEIHARTLAERIT